jgi:hypothetical protein
MCGRQPTVGLVVSKIKQNTFSAQTAPFLADLGLHKAESFPCIDISLF